MQSNRSHISTVRRLSTDAAAQEANAHASALAEMDAAISGLGDWQRQRELDLARLRLSMMRNQGEDEDDAALRKGVLYSDGGSKSDSEATFLTASDSCASSSLGNNCKEINNDDGDDPASRAYEDRLRAELAALQHRREKLEQQSLTDREEASGSGVLAHHHHMPTDLLISQDQLDQLTKDTRRHVGKKSVVALRSEVRELEAAAFDKQLRADQNRVTDPEMLREEDVTLQLRAQLTEAKHAAAVKSFVNKCSNQFSGRLSWPMNSSSSFFGCSILAPRIVRARIFSANLPMVQWDMP